MRGWASGGGLGGLTRGKHDGMDTSTESHPAADGTHDVAPPPAAVPVATARVVVDELSPAAVGQLHRYVEDASGGGNRFVWFLIGVVTTLVAGAVAAVVFLAVSDDDDDGTVDLEVPTVDVDVDP